MQPYSTFHATFLLFAVRVIARTLCVLFFRLSSRCPHNLRYYSTPLYAFPCRYLIFLPLFRFASFASPALRKALRVLPDLGAAKKACSPGNQRPAELGLPPLVGFQNILHVPHLTRHGPFHNKRARNKKAGTKTKGGKRRSARRPKLIKSLGDAVQSTPQNHYIEYSK